MTTATDWQVCECEHGENDHYYTDGHCIRIDCHCDRFTAAAEPVAVTDDSGYARLVDHLDDTEIVVEFATGDWA